MSKENAAVLIRAGLDELTVATRENLKFGSARIFRSGVDQTDSLLHGRFLKPKSHKRKKLEQMAREGGLECVYQMLYRFASLPAHGSFLDKSTQGFEINGVRNALVGIGRGIGHIAAFWLTDKKPIAAAEILEIIGWPTSNNSLQW